MYIRVYHKFWFSVMRYVYVIRSFNPNTMMSCRWRYSTVAATLYCRCEMVEVLYGAYHSNKWNTYGLSLLRVCVKKQLEVVL